MTGLSYLQQELAGNLLYCNSNCIILVKIKKNIYIYFSVQYIYY